MPEKPGVPEMLGAILDGPGRPLDSTKVGTLIVSTVFTSDWGYETAILDVVGAHPVERYDSIEAARAGHEKWVGAAPTLFAVTKLGYGDLKDDETVILQR